MLQNYQVTICVGGEQIIRNVTASGNFQAMTTALNTLPDDQVPIRVTCKPHAEVCMLRPPEEAIG